MDVDRTGRVAALTLPGGGSQEGLRRLPEVSSPEGIRPTSSRNRIENSKSCSKYDRALTAGKLYRDEQGLLLYEGELRGVGRISACLKENVAFQALKVSHKSRVVDFNSSLPTPLCSMKLSLVLNCSPVLPISHGSTCLSSSEPKLPPSCLRSLSSTGSTWPNS